MSTDIERKRVSSYTVMRKAAWMLVAKPLLSVVKDLTRSTEKMVRSGLAEVKEDRRHSTEARSKNFQMNDKLDRLIADIDQEWNREIRSGNQYYIQQALDNPEAEERYHESLIWYRSQRESNAVPEGAGP